MPRSSRSKRSELLLAALAVAGCRAEVAGVTFERLDFRIDQAGGAAVVATWQGVDERDDLDIGVAAALTHHGAEPCHVAVYLHASQPDPKDIPTLTGPPAPATAGEPIFEAILLPPRDDVLFTTQIGMWDELFASPDEFHHFPGEPPTTRRWLTVATCAAPDIAVATELSLGFSGPSGPRGGGGPDAMSAELLWP